MIIADEHIAQSSLEWLMLRIGVLTASRVSELVSSVSRLTWYGDCGTQHGRPEIASRCRKCTTDAETSGVDVRLSSQRKQLLYKLAAEWATDEPSDAFDGSYWTERGEALEGQARAYFELQTGYSIREVPFIYRDEAQTAGCSPDGLVMDSDDLAGGLELKCPAKPTHVQYLLAQREDGTTPYAWQTQFSLWVTGLPRWWFMSYYPGLPPVLQEILPDPDWQAAFDEQVPAFIAELDKAKQALAEMGVKA